MSNQEYRDPQGTGEDAALRGAWRQASDELPPSELDAAIVAAARRSVENRGRATKTASEGKRSRNWITQWQPLAAAATVAGLAFILLQVMPRDRDVAPSIRMEESVPAPATPRPGTTELAPTERAAAVPGTTQAAVAEQKTGGQLAGSTNVDVPPPSAGAAADQGPAEPSPNSRANVATPEPARAGEEIAVPKASAEVDRQPTVMPRDADSGASIAAPAPEKRQRDEAAMNATEWSTRIEALYQSGDLAGAVAALRAFRAAEPDADSYLPDSLRDWARTVK